MNKKPSTRKLRMENLEDRRLAAGINLQYTNLLNLQQQTASKTTPAQQSSMTAGSFKSAGTMAPGIGINHNETLIGCSRRGG